MTAPSPPAPRRRRPSRSLRGAPAVAPWCTAAWNIRRWTGERTKRRAARRRRRGWQLKKRQRTKRRTRGLRRRDGCAGSSVAPAQAVDPSISQQPPLPPPAPPLLTPRHAQSPSLPCLRALLAAGAAPHVEDTAGCAPLHIALEEALPRRGGRAALRGRGPKRRRPEQQVDGSLYRKLKPNHAQGSSGYMFEKDMTRRGGPSAGQSCGAARAARHVASLPRTAEDISRLLLRCASSPRVCGDVQRFKPDWERGCGGCGLREERRATCAVCQWPDTDAAPSLDQVRVGAAPRAASLYPRALRDSMSRPSLLVGLVRSRPRGHASKGLPSDA